MSAIRAMRGAEPDREHATTRRALIGSLAGLPITAVAPQLLSAEVPAELVPQLLDSYDTWLVRERDLLRIERYGTHRPKGDDTRMHPRIALYDMVFKEPFDFWWADNPAMTWICDAPPASTRAALVLSTIGVDWRKPTDRFKAG